VGLLHPPTIHLMRKISTLLLLAFFFGQLSAQSTAYILQGGPTLGSQKWENGGDQQVLFKYHVALAIESVNNEDDKSAGFLQIGYHVKGSAVRNNFANVFTGGNSRFSKEYRFNNLSVAVGAKQKFALGTNGMRYFYFGALRGDYTLSSNIKDLNDEYGANYVNIFDPQDEYVKRLMFGLSIGGGLQLNFSELIGGQLTLSICPDITNQYRQPAIPNIIDPFGSGANITIPERRIRNTAVEISFGIRLLHKVEIVE